MVKGREGSSRREVRSREGEVEGGGKREKRDEGRKKREGGREERMITKKE